MVSRLSIVLILGLALGGCKTITEELPSSPSSTAEGPVVNVPLPVQVTPIPLPQPEGPAPTTPTPTGTTPPPAPEGNGDDSDQFIPDNTAPVARVLSKVFFVECNGEVVPGSENAQTAEVGCRVHLDTTPKDAGGKPTQAKNSPRWSYSDQSAFSVGGNSPFNPVLQVNGRGSTSIQSEIDGVQSNTLFIRFQ